MSKFLYTNIDWEISLPVKFIKFTNANTNTNTNTNTNINNFLNQKIKIGKNDKISLVFIDNLNIKELPNIYIDIKGDTLKDLLKSIEKGMDTKIKNNVETNFIYNSISGFTDSKMRLRLINLYEHNKLKPKDLLGDHIFFAGIKRLKNGIWIINLDS